MVIVATFSKPEEAHLLRMRLEAGGIRSFIRDENTIQMDWFYSNALGGVRVEVAEADALGVGVRHDYFAPGVNAASRSCARKNSTIRGAYSGRRGQRRPLRPSTAPAWVVSKRTGWLR